LSLVFLWDIFGGLLRRTEVCDCVCVCVDGEHTEKVSMWSLFFICLYFLFLVSSPNLLFLSLARRYRIFNCHAHRYGRDDHARRH
jgi:hypothetical protein